jgi:hypothetical protein
MLVFDLGRFADDVARSYDRRIVDTGKENQMTILFSFLVTFVIVRIVTHAIRAGRWRRVLHNLQTAGGTHLHHLVIGIVLLLASGYLGIGVLEEGARRPVAVMFGIGAALTLDEFALWLHLEDVYWAKEGRQSIDAVVVATTLAGLAVLGSTFWVDLGRATRHLVFG